MHTFFSITWFPQFKVSQFDYSTIVFFRASVATTLKTCVAGIHKYLLTDNASYQLT